MALISRTSSDARLLLRPTVQFAISTCRTSLEFDLDSHNPRLSPYEISRGKEVKSMTYEKPEIAPLGPASGSIQNNLKGWGILETHSPFRPTNGAYQADE